MDDIHAEVFSEVWDVVVVALVLGGMKGMAFAVCVFHGQKRLSSTSYRDVVPSEVSPLVLVLNDCRLLCFMSF